MAWGCFSAIPCPYKKWDEGARNYMLGALPFIGLLHGLIFWGVAWLLDNYLAAPRLLTAALLAVLLPALSGFIHVDGYMDCCDAIFSRRDLAERQRILKDSAVGAFAAIGLGVLLLIQFVGMYEVLGRAELFPLIALIPMLSRFMSAEAVWNYKPLGTSQYSGSVTESDARSKRQASIVMIVLVLVIIAVFYVLFNPEGISAILTTYDMVLAVVLLVHYISCLMARKNLGGMSGDISGFAITISELAGIVAAAVC